MAGKIRTYVFFAYHVNIKAYVLFPYMLFAICAKNLPCELAFRYYKEGVLCRYAIVTQNRYMEGLGSATLK